MDIAARARPLRAAAAGALASGPLRRPETISDEILRRIGEGRLQRGQRFTERQLMQEFTASRAVVREAVAKLQAVGAVEQRQGVGATVLGMAAGPGFLASGAPAQAFELRIAIEAEAASIAAVRRSEEDLARLERAIDDDAAEPQPGSGARFHLAVAAATQNPHYARLLCTLLSAPAAAAAGSAGSPGPQPAAQRAEIVRAIRARDTAAAAAAMRMLLLATLRPA